MTEVGLEGSSEASSSTRLLVFKRADSKCWLCQCGILACLQVAHQISAARTERLQHFQTIGVAPASLAVGHMDNLLLLCNTCQRCFDCDHPYWIMVPTTRTLSQYIQHERRDYQRRVRAAANGISQPRTLPQVDKNRVLYQPCILEPTFMESMNLDSNLWPKVWGGEPVAAMLKAAGGIMQPAERYLGTAIAGKQVEMGVPDDLQKKFCELVSLWSRPRPQVAALPEKLQGRKRKRNRSSKSPEEEMEGLVVGRSGRKGKDKAKQLQPSDRALRSGRGKPAQVAHEQQTQPAALGPEMMANDVIERVLTWRKNIK